MKKEKSYLAGGIIISFFFHALFMSLVGIDLAPSPKTKSNFTNVSFLGPILEKTAFEILMDEYTVASETLYSAENIRLDTYEYLEAEGPSKKKDTNAYDNEKKVVRTFMPEKYKLSRKENAETFIQEGMFYPIRKEPANRVIEGPAADRALLYKPPMPVVTDSYYTDESYFLVKFKFVISGEGVVEAVEPIVSSGYPRVDMKLIKYIKQWKFAPKYTEEDTGTAKDWGNVKLLFQVN